MNRSLTAIGFSFAVLFLLQVLVFKKIVLFNTAFCFIYIAFILLLPTDTNPLVLLLAAFGVGLLIDIFYDHQGMHAAASVAVAYLRNYWLAALTPQGGYDSGVAPAVGSNGFGWFVSYAGPLLFLHHLILFFIDAGGFTLVWLPLAKALASTLFTLVVLIIHQYIFFQRQRS